MEIGKFLSWPFRRPESGDLSPIEKGCCVTGAGASAYAGWQLAKATTIVAARAGVGCFSTGYTSFLVPLSKTGIWFLKDAGASASCPSELSTLVIFAVGMATTGVVGYKLLKTWPNPTLSFGQ